jgi:HK97 gp10 family phage protein
MPVTHILNAAAIQKLLNSPSGPVAKDMLKRGLRVESAAKKNLQSSPKRVNTGRLRSSIKAKLITVNGHPAVTVGTDVKYARFVHDGTGLYGPYHTRIYPKTKKALRWKGKSGFVFAKSTAGMRPNPFLRNALSAAHGITKSG